jgi:hypothetical protein
MLHTYECKLTWGIVKKKEEDNMHICANIPYNGTKNGTTQNTSDHTLMVFQSN